MTPRIVQGTWVGRRYPGTPTFVAHCEQLARAFPSTRAAARRAPIAALWRAVEERCSILESLHPHRHRVVGLLVRIGAMCKAWVRSPEDFRSCASSPQRQVGELIAHLFARYEAPAFFESAWWPERPTWKRDWPAFNWYVHVAGGGSLRTAPGLPTRLTRRAAHEAMRAPDSLTPRQALRWGQVRAVGAAEPIAFAILRTPIALDFEHDHFWQLLFAKIADTPLRPEEVGPLIDYVRHQRFVAPNGERFSVRGRSIPALLRAMERWHRDLGQHHRALLHLGGVGLQDRTWLPLSGVEPLSEESAWSLQELCSFRELFAEGRRMHHCVATYVHSCIRGDTSIWSLTHRDQQASSSRVTIRIDKHSRSIVEARSVANRPISRSAYRLIQSWAKQNHLRIEDVTVS
ncbi:MAG: PcfJ domain-containing protein [Myxococcota bacterium]